MTTYTAPTQTFDTDDSWQPAAGDDSWNESSVNNGNPTDLGSPPDPQIHDNATTSFHPASGEGVNARPDRFRVSLNAENMDFVVQWDHMLAQPPWTIVNEEQAPEVGSDCEPPGRNINISSWRRVSTKVWFKITRCWIIINVTTEWERAIDNYFCNRGTWEGPSAVAMPGGSTTRTSRFAICRPRPV